MLLAPKSQRQWSIALFVDYGGVQGGNNVSYLIEQNLASHFTAEHYWTHFRWRIQFKESLEIAVIFDLFMKATKVAHKLWVDLSGEASVIDSKESQTLDGDEPDDVFCEV